MQMAHIDNWPCHGNAKSATSWDPVFRRRHPLSLACTPAAASDFCDDSINEPASLSGVSLTTSFSPRQVPPPRGPSSLRISFSTCPSNFPITNSDSFCSSDAVSSLSAPELELDQASYAARDLAANAEAADSPRSTKSASAACASAFFMQQTGEGLRSPRARSSLSLLQMGSMHLLGHMDSISGTSPEASWTGFV